MATRRTFLVGSAVALTAVSGCLGIGQTDSGGDDGTEEERESPSTETDPGNADPSYSLTASPVETNDGLEPVLSTDDEAVAELEPLVEIIEEVTTVFETIHRPISAADAEQFRTITADVEPYFDGNPPGYYVGHESGSVSRRVSVSLRGG